MSLGTNECDFFLNATLDSLVDPTQLHCIFSNAASNFKWFEWWAFHLLPGQCNPGVPRIHKALFTPCDSHASADLKQSFSRAHMALIAA